MSGIIGGAGSKSGVIGARQGSRIKFGRTHFGAQTTGAVSVTGVTFKPTKLLVFVFQTGAKGAISIGFASNEGVGNDDDAVALGLRAFADDSYYNMSAVGSTFQVTSGGDPNYQNLNFTSFDADGFTLTRVVTGSPGDHPTHFAWIAFE